MYNTNAYRKEIDEMIIKIALRQIDNSSCTVYNYISRHFDYLTISEQSNIYYYLTAIGAIK